MDDSIFTKIIKGEIPCHKVYEDDKTLAFMDIYPIQAGQVVVVPKLQVPFVWDLPQEDYSALMTTVQKVGQKLRQVFPKRRRIGVRIEGLYVDNHAHVVLLPFDTAQEYTGHGDNSEPDHQKLAEMAESLKI